PLFQVMLVLQNNEKGTLELPDLTLSPVAQSGSIAKYDLTLNVAETSEGLQLGWNYKTDLFNAETIERLAKHFELLLTGLLKQPEDNVFSIDMLPAEEVHQQLIEWNDTAADYPKDKCIHELFEAQVATNPDAVAVVFEDKQLTYGELNAKANQLARYLIEERQVTPDTLVGICIERSLEMIVGIMAILKAGGAYVPLDPSYPKARLEYMLADASLSTVLTQYRLQDETPVTQAQRVTIDSEELLTQLQAYSADNVVIQELNSNHLAYVIYTSGSTGAPKGVMVEHSGLVNFACFDQSILKINVKSQILNTLSLGFDAGNGYLFGAMSAGATLHLIYPFNNICDYILENGISHLGLTPSILNDLALEKMESLRFVISGGDELNINALDKISSHTKLYNAYGPTENTIAATYSQINVEQISGIGKPNANIQCYILSDSLSLSPIGVAGELHIGGAGLARGYLHNPKLTANKFIENPFYDANNASSSERLYKTGDLVRWLPDGNLEFLGRIDHQVKIRGFRIELGEIEHQLLSYDEVNDAVVVALSTEEGDKRLVGYVTHDDAVQMLDDSDDAQALRHDFIDSIRHQLQQDLPDYMVPSAFVVLESLPLTPGGKVDRKSLPAPDMSLQQKTYVAPTTETEQKLCEIWQEVLGIERVGITDNFFELGGHSLLVTKLITMINKSFDILIPVKIAFEIQTVESFSIVLQECEILKDIEGKEGRFPVQNEISITIK
ncbi:MAG: amino acid adenylation domain-containing protein, partial [Alteromonadaceae bacterium]|nr:amino acid adenylation domain-containing protein [Alteromonadaceae bacterium]